jgi:hypothetical protein
MGDRANIYLIDDDTRRGIYLYTGKHGENAASMLRIALRRTEGHWDNGPGVAAAIMTQVMRADSDRRTESGVSTYLIGNDEWPVFVVDLRNQRVYMAFTGQEVEQEQWGFVGNYHEVSRGTIDPRSSMKGAFNAR